MLGANFPKKSFPPPAIILSIFFSHCLKHRQIISLSLQGLDVTPFPCALAFPVHPGAKSGNERSGARALTSCVNRSAELQTACWLTRPAGRQHVWHHATCHIWQRWRGSGLNDVYFSFSLWMLHLIFNTTKPYWALTKNKHWMCINDVRILH